MSQAFTQTSQASTIVVDTAISTPNNGCTLIEAIRTANLGVLEGSPTFGDCIRLADQSDDGNTVVLPSNSTQELTSGHTALTGNPNRFTGLPFVTSKLTILGNNTTIKRLVSVNSPLVGTASQGVSSKPLGGIVLPPPEFRLLAITGSEAVDLQDLTLSGGRVDSYRGGGVYIGENANVTMRNVTISGNQALRGGGIVNHGNLSLRDSTVSNNNALQRGGGIYSAESSSNALIDSEISDNTAMGSLVGAGNINGGGGLYAISSELTIERSVLSTNSAVSRGGGIALFTSNTVTFLETTISNNSSGFGGGIYARSSNQLSLLQSSVQGNSAPSGGGLFGSSVPDILIDQTTFESNTAVTGGGLNISSLRPTISNSTFSSNSANLGGGIAILSGDSLSLLNSTLTGNSASQTGGGLVISNLDAVKLQNNLFSGNLVGDGNIGSELSDFNSNSTFSIVSGNLFGDSSSNQMTAFDNFSPPLATNALAFGTPLSNILEPLFDNGGPSQTHALALNSPAINSAGNSACPLVDQRNIKRIDGKCDIGAFELIEDETCFVVKSFNSNVIAFCL